MNINNQNKATNKEKMDQVIYYNDKIRVDKLKVINEHGEFMGILLTKKAIQMAQESGLDLIQISSNPPIAKIMDYGKYVYDLKKKIKEKARQIRENTIDVKNIIISLNIDRHDLEQKFKKIKEFIEDGCNVKFILQLKGREMANKKLAFDLMNSCILELSAFCSCQYSPKITGKNIETLLISKKE